MKLCSFFCHGISHSKCAVLSFDEIHDLLGWCMNQEFRWVGYIVQADGKSGVIGFMVGAFVWGIVLKIILTSTCMKATVENLRVIPLLCEEFFFSFFCDEILLLTCNFTALYCMFWFKTPKLISTMGIYLSIS